MKCTIALSELIARRAALMQHMGKQSIAILWAAPELPRNADMFFPYRQESDFYYLTGFQEPHAAAVFIPGRQAGEFIFFNQPNDPDTEIWIGKRIGQSGACQNYGADEAYPIEKLNEMMPQLMAGKETVYYAFGVSNEQDKQLAGWLSQIRRAVRSGAKAPENIVNIHRLTHEMRLIKSDAEIQMLRHAAEISAQAHVLAMKACKTAQYEYEVEATLWHHLASQGFRAWAYSPIVGAGANACVLHYIDNMAPLVSGDLLLVDAGGEYGCYAADITRTYPIDGRFSPEQKSIYELVLRAQKAGIASIKPGALWCLAQENIIRVLIEGLVALGILKGSVNDLIAQEAHKPFYMHNSGHWLGLDTHDVGNYKINDQWRELKPGMVLTVEPGLYIRANTPQVDPRWWNIGVRIEDDVVVTVDGCDILSAGVPKEVNDIEALMA